MKIVVFQFEEIMVLGNVGLVARLSISKSRKRCLLLLSGRIGFLFFLIGLAIFRHQTKRFLANVYSSHSHNCIAHF